MPKSSTAMRTPSALRLLEPLDRRLDVGHDRALGDLEVDPARLDAGLAQDPVDVLLEVGSTQLPLRDVDADGDQRVQDAPLGHLPAGVLEHTCPSGTTSPVSSASGMKESGAISPRCGCSHRTNASSPTRRPVSIDTIGW